MYQKEKIPPHRPLKKPATVRFSKDRKIVTLEKKSTSTEGWGKMIFDNFDFEFLRLIGISKYIPTGLYRKYDMSIFDSGIIYNLLHHRLIKMSNDRRSYKLTKRGRDSLKDMGFDDAKYARTDIKRGTYVRLLKNGQCFCGLTTQ